MRVIKFKIDSTTDDDDSVLTVPLGRYESPQLFTAECPGSADLNTIYRNFAPYLYPFIIEFCILIVGIFYMMWANINHCPKKLSAAGHGHGHGHGSHHHGSTHNLDSAHFTSLGSIPEEGNHLPANGGVHHSPPSEISDHCKNLTEHDSQYKSNIVVYADCHASSRGLFSKANFGKVLKSLHFHGSIGGMVLMILTIVFIILLHVAVIEP